MLHYSLPIVFLFFSCLLSLSWPGFAAGLVCLVLRVSATTATGFGYTTTQCRPPAVNWSRRKVTQPSAYSRDIACAWSGALGGCRTPVLLSSLLPRSGPRATAEASVGRLHAFLLDALVCGFSGRSG